MLTLRPGAAHGDGGAVRLSQQAGPYRVTVFTAPPPPRWVELWPWFAWPAVPVVLFVLHQVLARKGRQGDGGGRRTPRLGA